MGDYPNSPQSRTVWKCQQIVLWGRCNQSEESWWPIAARTDLYVTSINAILGQHLFFVIGWSHPLKPAVDCNDINGLFLLCNEPPPPPPHSPPLCNWLPVAERREEGADFSVTAFNWFIVFVLVPFEAVQLLFVCGSISFFLSFLPLFFLFFFLFSFR